MVGDEGLEVAAQESDLPSQANMWDAALANCRVDPTGPNREELRRVNRRE
jgi:hypothetical protein